MPDNSSFKPFLKRPSYHQDENLVSPTRVSVYPDDNSILSDLFHRRNFGLKLLKKLSVIDFNQYGVDLSTFDTKTQDFSELKKPNLNINK